MAAAFALTPGLGLAGQASAQEDLLAGNIRAVIVEGNQRIEARTVQSYLLLEAGDPFDGERIDLSLKTLFATGLFADVAIDRRGSDLIVRVVENPIINRVIFEGNRALDDDKLREEIQAAPRGIFTAARVQADVQRILELYRQSGRFSATVEPEYKPLDQNRVDLIFKMTEGPVTGVRSINFIGNEVYADRRLRSEIVTKQSRWWRFFSSNDNYDPGRLEYDREVLRQFYQNNGYYDFRVVSAVADLTPDQEDFYITFTIDEGEQYDFGEIKVETALEKLNANGLRRAVAIQEGDLYQGDRIEDAIDTLTFAAGVAGYAFVDIRPRIEADPVTNKVNVTFAIDEGPRVYVERINIVGNTRTLDRVIRRELRITEGDAFNRILLDRSRNRVRALGFFGDVAVTEEPGSEADRTVVNVSVEEQPTGELSFAAGFSSVDAFLIDVSVTQRNLRGTGQSLVARVSASDRNQYVDFRFTEPRFLDRNLAAGLDLFATRSNFLDVSNFETQTYGAGLRVGFPLTERTNLGLRYRLQSDEINVDDDLVVIDADGNYATEEIVNDNGTPDDPSDDFTIPVTIPPTRNPLPEGTQAVNICSSQIAPNLRSSLCDSERADISSILGYTFQWDRRNDPIEPTRGFDMSFSQDFAGLGGDVKYLRTEATAAWYRGLWRGFRFSSRFSTGYIFPLGGDDTIRINNRFFRGGSSFRGFDVAGLGPREMDRFFDEDGNEVGLRRGRSLGGNLYYQGTFELAVPNLLPEEYGIKTALFADAGSLGWLEDTDQDDPIFYVDQSTGVTRSAVRFTEDELTLRASAGLSVFWDSPFGPIRFDFSQILRKEEYDRTETFRFSTSTRF
ncbi:MAG: outer membrane protein assembly factor BamA [Hyphomonadaceae bacterium]|nr:outer membrane protein assembly factor BamA [Hyphomonadaceae bacterium]